MGGPQGFLGKRHPWCCYLHRACQKKEYHRARCRLRLEMPRKNPLRIRWISDKQITIYARKFLFVPVRYVLFLKKICLYFSSPSLGLLQFTETLWKFRNKQTTNKQKKKKKKKS